MSTLDRYTEEPGVLEPVRLIRCDQCQGAEHWWCVRCRSATCEHCNAVVRAMLA